MAIPGIGIEIRESKVKKVISFIEPQMKFKEILIASFAAIFFGIRII